jgi:hypothetical protein
MLKELLDTYGDFVQSDNCLFGILHTGEFAGMVKKEAQ